MSNSFTERTAQNLLNVAQTRSFAAVLFRKQASKSRKAPGSNESKELFLTLSNEAKDAIRSKLLEGLAREQVNQTRNKIGDAIAEIARQYVDAGKIDPFPLCACSADSLREHQVRSGWSSLQPCSRQASPMIPACGNARSGYSQLRRGLSKNNTKAPFKKCLAKASRIAVWM